MSHDDVTTPSGAGPARRSPRQGVGGSPVGSTLSIVLAVVAVIVGFLILRDLTGEDSVAGSSDRNSVDGGNATTTTFDPGVTTTLAPAPTTTAPPLVTEGATVAVANGNTVGGSAGRMSETLGAAGYNMASPVNASSTIEDSIVYYDPGNPAAQAVAESVARSLGNVAVETVPSPAPTDSGSLDGAGVLVVLGNNQADKTLELLAEEAGLSAAPELSEAPPVAGGDVVAPVVPGATDDANGE